MKTKSLLATLLICLIINLTVGAQTTDNDSVNAVANIDTTVTASAADTLATAADSLSVADSSATKKPKAKKNLLTTDVKTSAKDSTIFSLDGKKVFLFGDAKIEYEDIVLTAAYIEADMDQGIIYAEGVADSTGTIQGKPVFTQGDEEMKAINITYNVNTKRGYIEKLYTEQEDGYLHSELTKKEVDNSINMLHGKYTTCELEDPHFYLELTKGKYIPDKAIIAGPSYMVMADIPLPLVIPFGYFPITKKKTSGFLMPRVGEENNRGFFLSDGGYYFAGNDYVDFTLRGSIYSKGSWSLNGSSRYTLRYKFSGDVNVTYAKNVFGDKGLKGYSEPQEYRIGWSHRQDPKARPNSTFSASVNFSSSGYNKYQTRSSQDYLTNTTSSSISYRMDRIMNSPFSLSIDIRHTQNTCDSSLSLTLPSFSLTMSRIQPFKRRKAVGPMRWYEDIGISYKGVFINEVKTHIDSLFTHGTLEKFEYSVKHSPTLTKSFKVLKFFNLSPGASYGERWFFKRHYIEAINDTTPIDSKHYREREERGFYRVYDYSFSLGLNTTLYGMYSYRRGPVKALRHVITPEVRYSWRPDFGQEKFGYYETDPRDPKGTRLYSPYGNKDIPGSGRSSSFRFSLNNKLEMKVKDESDTVKQERKVPIFEALNFSTSYNMLAEEFKWSDLNITAKTTLFKSFPIQINATGCFYAIDSLGKKIDKFQYDHNGKLFRITKASTSYSYTLSSDKLYGKNKKKDSDEKTPVVDAEHSMYDDSDLEEYDYFDIPWSLSFSYSLTYSKLGHVGKLSQSLSFNGNFSLTPNWKISFNSGYDFDAKKFTYTTFHLTRELHCWTASLNLIPFGPRQSYTFNIAVKSAILQDLKYNKSKTWYDN